MKQVLLLFAKVAVDAGLTHPDDLVRLLNESGKPIQAYQTLLEDLVFYIDNDQIDVWDRHNQRSLSTYDGVYFRYWGRNAAPAVSAARFLQSRGIPFIDPEVLRPGSQDKLNQYVNLHEANVPIPRTLAGPLHHLAAMYRQYDFTFPLILKSAIGTRGEDNYLVRTAEQLAQIVATHTDTPFVLQSFIPNDGDYRVLVMGGEVVGVIERKATGDTHLNNTSQGGSATWVPIDTLPAQVRELCVRASAFFGRDIAGVDMVRSTEDGQYYCFEVNRAPQIEHASYESQKIQLLAERLLKL